MKKCIYTMMPIFLVALNVFSQESMMPHGTPIDDATFRKQLIEMEKEVDILNAIPKVDGRKSLLKITGSGREPALRLLEAIQNNSPVTVVEALSTEVIASGNIDPILMLLRDQSDSAKQGSATALSSVKTRKVAQTFLVAWKFLTGSVGIGGSESDALRRDTKRIFIKSLSKITDVNLAEDLKDEEKIQILTKATKKMKN